MPAPRAPVPAFCLHVRPYRETSVIAQLFTADYGRVPVLARGIKQAGNRRRQAWPLLQPFIPLVVELAGKSDMKVLAAIEACGPAVTLSGESLFAGLYVNELLCRLLAEHVEYVPVFSHYHDVILALSLPGQSLEQSLRRFETRLLDSLGYGIPFVEIDAEGYARGDLQSGCNYRFVGEAGFVRVNSAGDDVFAGEHLLAFSRDQLDDPATLLAAKRLVRSVFAPLLGSKPLNSRSLFS